MIVWKLLIFSCKERGMMYQDQPAQGPNIHTLVTTAMQLDGYRVVRNFGIVRGIIVRSRSVVGNIGAAFQQIVGGDLSIYTELFEKTRADAYERIIPHALKRGTNPITAVRYDAK